MNQERMRFLVISTLALVFCIAIIVLILQVGNRKNQNITQPIAEEQLVPRPGYKFYFAYGSNMNNANMAARCGANIKKIGVSQLVDYEFGFDHKGYANIRPAQGESVWGVVWEIDTPCIKALDRYEGYPNMYGRQDVLVGRSDSKLPVFVYIESAVDFGGVPRQDYLNKLVIPGAKENKLPQAWIQKLEGYIR